MMNQVLQIADGLGIPQKFSDYFTTLAVLWGSIKIIQTTLKFSSFLYRQTIRGMLQPSNRIYKNYGGKGSYAVVSGGSDGIGLAMCKQLANEGFNICIVARNEDKMKEKLIEIKGSIKNQAVAKDFKGMYVVCDFAKLSTVEEYQVTVANKLKEVDIGVLILNAGTNVMGPFKDIRNDEVERIVNVNAIHVIYMAKTLLPQMLKRHQDSKKMSAMIITSSGLGARPISGTMVYSAAKSFSSFLGEALSFECKGKIDVMSYQAGEVTTKLLKRYKTDSRTITPEMASKCCLRDVGYQAMSRGSGRHEFSMLFMDYLPLQWIQKLMFGASIKVLAKTRKAQEAYKKDN